VRTFTKCYGGDASDEFVRRSTQVEQRPVPPESSTVAPEPVEQEVDGVGHEHETEQVQPEPPDRLLQSLEQPPEVTLVLEDGSPEVATEHHVMDRAGIFAPQRSGHGPIISHGARPENRKPDLTSRQRPHHGGTGELRPRSEFPKFFFSFDLFLHEFGEHFVLALELLLQQGDPPVLGIAGASGAGLERGSAFSKNSFCQR